MAVDLGGAGGAILNLLTTGLFWGVLVFLLLLASIGSLWIRKRRKLQYNTIIISDLGGGKVGVQKTRAGWFKSRTFLFGLWDYGREEYMRIKDGRKVQGASSEDFHDIFGRRGLIVKRKDDDNNILVPLTSLEIKNYELIGEIAPADYRDASVDIVKQAEKETRNRLGEIMQWIMFGGIIIFALIAIILITQMVQRGQAEAKDLILKAGECGVRALKSSAP